MASERSATTRLKAGVLTGIAIVLVGIGGCGGGGSGDAEVGDCIDASNQVVDCGSGDATQKLVSDQSAPDAIACIEIGEKPQVQVKVGDGAFCAEPK
jgi:hypothetical protein